MTKRTLVAGFGNSLRGDDGFGISVIQQMERDHTFDHRMDLLEVGTGGLGLVQTLFDGYDRLIIVDAMSRGKPPGTLSILAVDSVGRPEAVDLHLATPSQALPLAQSLGVLPKEVYLVGCEAEDVDELTMRLSQPVADAVPRAVAAIHRIVESAATSVTETPQ